MKSEKKKKSKGLWHYLGNIIITAVINIGDNICWIYVARLLN